MNSVKNISVIRWFDYQYDFSFDQCDQDLFVLHTNTGNRLTD